MTKAAKAFALAAVLMFCGFPASHMVLRDSAGISIMEAHAYREGDARLNRWLGVNTRRVRWCGLYLAKITRNPPRDAASVSSWRRWGKRTSCRAGTVAIFKHSHVGKVRGVRKGALLVESGNDGNAVKTRWRRMATVRECRVN